MILKAKKYQPQSNTQAELKDPPKKPIGATKENINEEKKKVENEEQNAKASEIKNNERINIQNSRKKSTAISCGSKEENKASGAQILDTDEGKKIIGPYDSVISERSKKNLPGGMPGINKPNAQEKGKRCSKSNYRGTTAPGPPRKKLDKLKKDRDETIEHSEGNNDEISKRMACDKNKKKTKLKVDSKPEDKKKGESNIISKEHKTNQ